MKRTCIKQLPNVLVTVLKRFELNYDTMAHIKLNSRLEFPKTLNMKEYTVEYIEKQALLKEIEDKNLSIDQLDNVKREILEREYPEDYYQFQLRGIIIHAGEANSGHYFSFIKERDDVDRNGRREGLTLKSLEDSDSINWYEFNDSLVSPFDIEDLDDKAFGGECEIYFTNEAGTQECAKTDKSSNAYMLVYERTQMYIWENNDDQEQLFKVDEYGNVTQKVDITTNQEEIKIVTDEGDSSTSNTIQTENTEESDIEAYMKNREKHTQEIMSGRKDSMHYDIHIPTEFKEMIQAINMKEWQLKYIF